MQTSSNHYYVRVVVLGVKNTGKTALVHRYMKGAFTASYDSVPKVHCVDVNPHPDSKITLEIVDRPGNDNNMNLNEICQGDAFVIVYSQDVKNSFEMAEKIYKSIAARSPKNEMPPVLFVKNKVDTLMYDETSLTNRVIREMTITADWNCDYVEASAKDDTNVDIIWSRIIDRLMEKTNEPRLVKGRNISVSYHIKQYFEKMNNDQGKMLNESAVIEHKQVKTKSMSLNDKISSVFENVKKVSNQRKRQGLLEKKLSGKLSLTQPQPSKVKNIIVSAMNGLSQTLTTQYSSGRKIVKNFVSLEQEKAEYLGNESQNSLRKRKLGNVCPPVMFKDAETVKA